MTRTQLMVRQVRPALEDALAVVMCPLGQPDGPSLALPLRRRGHSLPTSSTAWDVTD